jgi:Fe-Mn family superoxide dismutase
MESQEVKHAVKAMPFAYDNVKRVMDEETYNWHHDIHYAGYVNRMNEIEGELAKADRSKANTNYSTFRELKLEETWNACGMLLHELYWGSMDGDGKFDDSMKVVKRIISDFGSFQAWKEDMIATAKSARGWAVLCIDGLSDGRLRNVMLDVHDQGNIVGATPLIVIDVFEHAYYHRWGADRAAYLNALLDNIDWGKVEKRFIDFSD